MSVILIAAFYSLFHFNGTKEPLDTKTQKIEVIQPLKGDDSKVEPLKGKTIFEGNTVTQKSSGTKSPMQPQNNSFADTIIDGERFFLDLTNSELEALGFDIYYHVVFYRNTSPKHRILFFTERAYTYLNRYGINILQQDTFPQNFDFNFVVAIQQPLFMPKPGFKSQRQRPKFNQIQLIPTLNDHYPLFTSDLEGNTISAFSENKLENCQDTLIPVIVRFSRLNCERKKDMIFWFQPSNEFFRQLPERYKWVEKEYLKIKQMKQLGNNKNIVKYDIQKWVNKQLFPVDTIIYASDRITYFNDKELEAIGMFRAQDGILKFHYSTSYGKSTGIPNINETDSGRYYSYDTTFYTDFLTTQSTYENGQFTVHTTSAKEMDQFLVDDDVLFPVKTVNFGDTSVIYWFNITDSLWSLLPERCQKWRESYNKILFHKSFYPDKNIVQYISQVFWDDISQVTLLDLDKKELENLGFVFYPDSVIFNCTYLGEYEKYSNKKIITTPLPDYMMSSQKVRESLNKSFEFTDCINPEGYSTCSAIEFDVKKLIEQTPNKDFQFLWLTDTEGRNVNTVFSNNKLSLNENNRMTYLIPVLVKQSILFSEHAEDRIFWFTPTEAFFDKLPERYKEGLRKEFNAISSNILNPDKTQTCTYFEECRATLLLTGYNLYPNPATHNCKIEFELEKATQGKILLSNITGSIVKEFITNSNFGMGKNSFDLNLNGISPGIYLVTISTKAGMATKRLIVSD
ncbi:MAG: T9SS type A sorting domain-containing protein [Salinivirgaceae bacterium]